MAIRKGKVANLPNDIREQLNLRLLEGETGRELAAWLNALPGVQSVLGSQFSGSPISEVNLTHWRQGGYLQWLTERECFDSARALAEGDCNLAETGLSAERLLNILTLRYGQLLLRWDSTFDESVSETTAFIEAARKARILQGISRSVLAIHRIQSQQRCRTGVSTEVLVVGKEKAEPNRERHINDISTDQAGENVRFETAFDSSGDHSDAVAPDSPASAAPDPSPESPRPSPPRRTPSPKLAPGLTAAPLHPFSAYGPAGANPKILSGPIAPSSVHSKRSHVPFRTDPASAELLNAV
jgi:hypothetical protein